MNILWNLIKIPLKVGSYPIRRPFKFCFAVGCYQIGYQAYDMSWATIMHNNRDSVDLKKRYGDGTYAVISGVSNSNEVAREYALTLAKKGFNIILVDANGKAMEDIKNQVYKVNQNVKVMNYLFDHQTTDEWSEYEGLCKHLQLVAGGAENISILINNVDRKDPDGEKFHKSSDAELLKTINANSFPIVFMSRFLGPAMKARQNDSTKSAIINMTSVYADMPQKSVPIFSAAQSFSDIFSQNLGYENQDMDILTVKALPVVSSDHLLGVDAKAIVSGVMQDIGHERISYGHASHSMFRYWHLLKHNPMFFNPNTPLGKMYGL